VLPGEINAMKNRVLCNCGLVTMSGEVNVRFIALLSPFDRTQGPFVKDKSFNHRKYHLDPAAWVLSGEINAMKNRAHCDCGLAIMSGEVRVRFIALFSPFERTQGLVYLGIVSQVT